MADGLDMLAARMKLAACGWMNEAGHRPGNGVERIAITVQARRGADEVLGVGVFRAQHESPDI